MGKLKRVIELFQMVWSQLEAEAIKFILDFRFYGFSSERQKAQWEMGDETGAGKHTFTRTQTNHTHFMNP